MDRGSGKSLKLVWEQAVEPLRQQLGSSDFDNWVKPLKPLSISDGVLEIGVPNRMFASWVEQHYTETLVAAWRAMAGNTPRLRFNWQDHSRQGELFSDQDGQGQPNESDHLLKTQKEAHRRQLSNSGLVERYDFDSFVVGASNQFAKAAAMAVAGQPGTLYNPFFLFGGVGLGKTHLANAIGNAILQAAPATRVLSLTADTFTNQMIDAMARNKAPEFKNRMRRIDVLILDDVQFIAGRERTQEELFHIFNSLYQGGRQIILTSDKFPNEIRGVEERLCNRFGWGLVADIQYPDVETRMAILERRARDEGIDLPMDVATLIASRVDSNIRDLEGALTRISAFASLNRCAITTSMASELLNSMGAKCPETPTLEEIENRVSMHFGLKPGELQARRRTRKVAEARQLAMYIMRNHSEASFPAIGSFLGGRDHSTVVHACQAVNKRLRADPHYRNVLETVTRTLGCG
ncbi:MAG: chromosomal replication initiator protein DnaA [Deltaproteobacteria bacterium]